MLEVLSPFTLNSVSRSLSLSPSLCFILRIHIHTKPLLYYNHFHPLFLTWYQSVWLLNRICSNCAALHADDYQNRLTNREEIYAMNNQMGSALPTEKLDRTNFASWEYKMHQYLVGQGYWSYIKGAHENQTQIDTRRLSRCREDFRP